MHKDLSLILPAYNAAEILEKELPGIIAFLQSKTVDYEIIVVNDGSNDWMKSGEICRQYGCIFEKLDQNSGKGAALRKGFGMARGSYMIFTDSDLPFSYDNLWHVYTLLKTEQYDLVIGDRTHPTSKYYPEINTIRRWGSNLISAIGSRLLQGHIRDTQCGLKGFSKESAAFLFPSSITMRFAIDFELLFLATQKKYRVCRVPVQLRVFYPSTLRLLKDGPNTVLEILKAIVFHGRNQKKR